MLRIFKLGSLEHKIMPDEAAIQKLNEILTHNTAGGVQNIIWGPDLQVICIPDGTDVIAKPGSTEYVLADIKKEREYQDTKWGSNFDDQNTKNDWVSYIAKYAARAADTTSDAHGDRSAMEMFIKVAALATAAAESYYRNNMYKRRHYD